MIFSNKYVTENQMAHRLFFYWIDDGKCWSAKEKTTFIKITIYLISYLFFLLQHHFLILPLLKLLIDSKAIKLVIRFHEFVSSLPAIPSSKERFEGQISGLLLGWVDGCVLCHINLFRLLNTKSCSYISNIFDL